MTRPPQLLVASLLAAAFLWPSEDAAGGQGLPRVLLIVGAALLMLLQAARHPRTSPAAGGMRWGLADGGLLCLVMGHWAAAGVVLLRGGNARAALNLSFEWLGILCFWFCLRSLLLQRRARAVCLTLVIAMAAGLSSYGVWQHHVFYPRHAAWYQELRQEYDALVDSGDARAALQAAAIRRELQARAAWFDGNDRVRFEQRLLHSTEPMGVFGLANTLAGVLAFALVLAASAILTCRVGARPPSAIAVVATAVVGGLMLYCLVLTKSRSAWLGTLVGLGCAGLLFARSRLGPLARRTLIGGAVGGLLLVAAAALTGALDREVLSESPRSLQYRIHYWTGTVRMLADSPLWGAGPGNFRTAYLPYKLPQSSEEIRDPHNLLLDAWASGGLAGIIGLLTMLLAVTARRLRPTARDGAFAEAGGEPTGRGEPFSSGVSAGMPCVAAVAVGCLLQLGIQWVSGEPLDAARPEWLILPATALLAAIPVAGVVSQSGACLFPAGVALAVHLLAAGSLQYPVFALLLTLAAADVTGQTQRSGPPRLPVAGTIPIGGDRLRTMTARGAIPLLAIGLGLLVMWGLVPVWSTKQHLANAEYARRGTGNLALADQWLSTAVESDPLDPDPRQRLAELRAYQLMQVLAEQGAAPKDDSIGSSGSANVDRAVDRLTQACQSWRLVDQRSCGPWRLEAAWLAEAAGVQQRSDWVRRAVRNQIRVVVRYPSSARDWAQLARLLSRADAGDAEVSARQAARQALELDGINRDWGHSDRYLSDEEREWLTAAAASAE